jgi:hypothetical protein
MTTPPDIDELQILRQRVEQLEELCGLRETATPGVIGCRYRQRLTIALRLLLRRKLVTSRALLLATGSQAADGTATSYMHFARRQLAEWRITLHVVRRQDWFIHPADKPWLREALRGAAISPTNVPSMAKKLA